MQTSKNEKNFSPVFDTLAVLEQAGKTAESKVTVPSAKAVGDAKAWVDENEK